MPLTSLLLILLSVTLLALAQISLKMGMTAVAGQDQAAQGLVPMLLWWLQWVRTPLGIALHGLSMVVWLGVLAKVDVSQAYPFVGLGFVLTMLLGNQLLGEGISLLRFG